jgi:hypothetical protein
MKQSINDMDKLFLSELNPDEVHWEHGSFINQKCDLEGCGFGVTHCCFSDYSADAKAIKSLCDDHYKTGTQIKWLKRLKSRLPNLKD